MTNLTDETERLCDALESFMDAICNDDAVAREVVNHMRALQAELDKQIKWIQEMVEKAASGGTLDGYREMGKKCAALEAESEQWQSAAQQQLVRAESLEDANEKLEARVSGLEAARRAYASEFPPDKEGEPDVGSVHENIRKLKARVAELEAVCREVEAWKLDWSHGMDINVERIKTRVSEALSD